MPSPTEAALTEILREFGLPACNEDAVAQYLASRGAYVAVPPAVGSPSDAAWAQLEDHWAFLSDDALALLREDVRRIVALERVARGEAAA
jgi:hypothetical protein